MFNNQLPPGILDFRDEMDAPRTKTRSKRKVRAVTLSEEAYAGLQLLARRHNQNIESGHKNSVSELIERIGAFELIILDPRKLEASSKTETFKAFRAYLESEDSE